MPKKKVFFITMVTAILTLGMSISLQSLLAAWSNPSGDAPKNNVYMPIFNVSNDINFPVVNGYLTANNSFAVGDNVLVAKRSTGKVGIGTTSPASTLDINGDIKIGNSNVACSSSISGAVRYSSILQAMEYCDGTNWLELAVVDNIPGPFSFANLTDQELNTVVYSATATPASYTRGTATVSGGNSAQIRCNNSSWTTTCQLSDGQGIMVRQRTPNAYSSTAVATISMNSVSTQWSVITKPEAKLNCQAWYDAGNTADGVYAIDPDGTGVIAAQQVYCKMTGKWALVVGIDKNNRNHVNANAVTPNNIANINGKGKFSDAFINALQGVGRNEIALEAIPEWHGCKDSSVVEGFSSCHSAWQYTNCNFSSSNIIGLNPNYNNCITGDVNIEHWKNHSYGVGVSYYYSWGGFYATDNSLSFGLHEEWVDNEYRHYDGRMWVR